MNYNEIRAAIEGMAEEWNDADKVYDGHGSPDEMYRRQDPWVRVSIRFSGSSTVGKGTKPCVRRAGLVYLQVFTKDNGGSARALRLASSLSEHFEHKMRGSLETLQSSITGSGPDGDWYQVTLTVPFRAD